KKAEQTGNRNITVAFQEFLKEFDRTLGKHVAAEDGRELRSIEDDDKFVADFAQNFPKHFEDMDLRSPQKKADLKKLLKDTWGPVEDAIDARDQAVNSMKRGDELPSGVLQMVKVYVA